MVIDSHGLVNSEALVDRIRNDVPGLISRKREGSYWDFKREWHDRNPALLHDILCLANNLENDVSYLIIGVDDDDYSIWDVADNDLANRRNCQNVVDMLSKTSWGNGQAPFVVVEPLDYEGKTIDVVAIVSQREDMPYFLSRSSGDVRAWMIHTRRVDQNTPIDEGASWKEIQNLWKHHFVLDESPAKRVKHMMKDKDHWRPMSEVTGTDDKYYEFAPEYTIQHEPEHHRDGYEYYHLTQMDPRPSWYKITVKYHQTAIYDTLGICLDGGRYYAPAPNWSSVRWSERQEGADAAVSYCYYAKDSMDWALNEFLFDRKRHEAVYSRDRFLEMVLLFKDETERLAFEHVLQYDRNEFTERLESKKLPCADRLPEDYPEKARESLLLMVRSALVLQGMLIDYRAGTLVNEGLPTSRNW